jgi:two-component system, chemotaxis family, protein-glutamate methylesterase/glutaminase
MTCEPRLQRKVGAIAMGASAGGIEALTALLPALSDALPLPVFIVQHLHRERPSLLVDLFEDYCRLPVCEATDNAPVEPGTVYFAPPNYHLLIDVGPRIALSVDAPVHYSRPSIDVLFESAIDQYGSLLLAILLTGANEDGAAGIRAVCDGGGITIIQDPASAQVPAMPTAALANCEPDLVLDLAGIATVLAALPENCW